MGRPSTRRLRRGAAIPWALLGMGPALLVGTLAWTRAWSHRGRAALQATQWQAQLLAESGLACAEDDLWSRFQGGSSSQPNSTLVAAGTHLDSATAPPSEPEPQPCAVPFGSHGSVGYSIEDGDLMVPVLATGEVPFGDRSVKRSIRAVMAGSLDRNLFDVAISQWVVSAPPLDISGSHIVGPVRVKVEGTPPPGMLAQPRGPLGLTSYVPTSSALDTTTLGNRMREAFRAEDAFQGPGRYGPGSPPPGNDPIVHAGFGIGSSEVDLEGPFTGGTPWNAPPSRTLIVEGDVLVRGNIVLEGWTILARGRIALSRGARVRHSLLYAERGVVLEGDAVAQGQILSFGSFEMRGDSRVAGPSVVVCWASATGSKVVLDDRSVARAYLVALGGSATATIGREALLEGVVVSGGTLRVDGRVHGVAVAGRFDCGRAATSCTGTGTFDRTLLPPDFAVPLGLPGAQGLRVAEWQVVE